MATSATPAAALGETDIRKTREELAAAFRLIALLGWDDHVATHISSGCRTARSCSIPSA